MKKKLISFFGSDRRPLYKDNIFRALSYPNGHTHTLRYRVQHLSEDFKKIDAIGDNNKINEALEEYTGADGVYIYVNGNDKDIKPEDKVLEFIPIRYVTIKDAFYDNDTELYYFVITLKHFLKNDSISFDECLSAFTKPEFCKSIQVDTKEANWIEVIDVIKEKINTDMYLYISSFKKVKSDKTVEATYYKNTKESYYEIEAQQEYSLSIEVYQKQDNQLETFSIKASDNLLLNCPSNLNVGAIKDRKILGIWSKNVVWTKLPSFLSFCVNSKDTKTAHKIFTHLNIIVKKNWGRTIVFGLATSMVTCFLLFGQLATRLFDKSPNCIVYWLIPIISLVFGFGSSFLYHLFDKK